MIEDNTICIYHGHCADGYTAAWAINRRWPRIELYAANHGDSPPPVVGKDVLIVDFCYKRHVIIEMAKTANSILILDHHKSAMNDLVDLPDNVIVKFDMEKSGARLAWEYAFPELEAPLLVRHVEDRDLWRFNIDNTAAFQANVFSLEYTMDNWEAVHEITQHPEQYDQFINQGEAILRKHLKDVKELINASATTGVISGYEIPILNAPYFFSSEAGNMMSKGNPFAACYWYTATHRVWSLRSDKEAGLDVSIIAESYGGGGHKNAAGFREPLNKPEDLIIF